MSAFRPKESIVRRFIAAESDSLVIETSETDSLNNQHLRILKLEGTWRANEENELCFDVVLHSGPPQTYTFKGAWKLNNNQQIEYNCGDGPDVLVFKGYWDLSSASRLAYIFEGSSTSRFEFKAQLESPVLVPKKGQLRYRLGAGVRRSRLSGGAPVIILYGEWKFGRNLGLIFQMDYGRGRIRRIEFGAQLTFNRDKIDFILTNLDGQPLGLTLTMTHKFLKTFDAQAFIRLKSLRNEQAVEAGISVPF